MSEKLLAVAQKIVRALKVENGSTISAMVTDADSAILEHIKASAIEHGAKEVFLNSTSFGAPINYYFEQEFKVSKALRIFGGGLSWGMEYEYATNFNPDVIQAISVINYMFSNRRRWVSVEFPSELKSTYSGIELNDLSEKMFDAILYNSETLESKQRRLKNSLQGKTVKILGDDVNLQFDIIGKKAVSCAGRFNLPDGEVFIAPLERTMSGWIHFDNLDWGLLQDVTLHFDDGAVTKFTAKNKKMEKWLESKLSIDEGSNKACEFGIGTNDKVSFMVGDALWDEKKYGTFHIALGGGYGSSNVSIRHWDLVKDNTTKYSISVDGNIIVDGGKILI